MSDPYADSPATSSGSGGIGHRGGVVRPGPGTGAGLLWPVIGLLLKVRAFIRSWTTMSNVGVRTSVRLTVKIMMIKMRSATLRSVSTMVRKRPKSKSTA